MNAKAVKTVSFDEIFASKAPAVADHMSDSRSRMTSNSGCFPDDAFNSLTMSDTTVGNRIVTVRKVFWGNKLWIAISVLAVPRIIDVTVTALGAIPRERIMTVADYSYNS